MKKKMGKGVTLSHPPATMGWLAATPSGLGVARKPPPWIGGGSPWIGVAVSHPPATMGWLAATPSGLGASHPPATMGWLDGHPPPPPTYILGGRTTHGWFDHPLQSFFLKKKIIYLNFNYFKKFIIIFVFFFK
jgi:hypothetical protein